MFYFDSNTTVPLQCTALVFWGKAYVDKMSFGWLFLGIPIKSKALRAPKYSLLVTMLKIEMHEGDM